MKTKLSARQKAKIKKDREWCKIRVLAGAAYLDVVKPGWVKQIDLKKFDLGDSQTCILGLTIGDYTNSEDIGLDTNGQICFDMGFNAIEQNMLELMENEWRKLVINRRK